ncbi:MAG: glycerophosphodiester phosphodiesterase [Gemmatimonadales bacterium]|jgi:glycerophosphoryl diester phosphodiesterase|nr:glycerophosphodiester phosphodiesterase [Gemmatimonadales bacterium]
MARPHSIAHRGASAQELENSRAAFRRARQLGADGVELDVHATRDGAIVVHHDASIPGMGRIADLTLARVQGHHLANGETIPLLGEVLPLLRGLEVWVEVKGLEEYFDAILLRTLAEGPEPDRYAVHSFDHRLVRRLGQREPRLRRGVLLVARLIDPLQVMDAAGASVLWQGVEFVDRALVETLHAAGRRLIAWTANEEADIGRLMALGADGICTDHPDRVLALRG